MKIFILSTYKNKVYWTRSPYLSVKCQNFKDIQKTMPFVLNVVFTELYSKEYYFEENFTLAIAFYYFHIYILFHLLQRTNFLSSKWNKM